MSGERPVVLSCPRCGAPLGAPQDGVARCRHCGTPSRVAEAPAGTTAALMGLDDLRKRRERLAAEIARLERLSATGAGAAAPRRGPTAPKLVGVACLGLAALGIVIKAPALIVIGLAVAAVAALWGVMRAAQRPADAAPPQRDDALAHDLARLREELSAVEAQLARLSAIP